MTDLEKRAGEYTEVSTDSYKDCLVDIDDIDVLKEAISEVYEAGATQETTLLSQHILDLQKDKGNLTDKVRELEQQIEKLGSFISKNERNNDMRELVESARNIFKKVIHAEESCPDCFCEDCTKKDCEIKKLGLVEVEK